MMDFWETCLWFFLEIFPISVYYEKKRFSQARQKRIRRV